MIGWLRRRLRLKPNATAALQLKVTPSTDDAASLQRKRNELKYQPSNGWVHDSNRRGK